MKPQQQISVDDAQDGANALLPFPKEHSPDDVLKDNTDWFANISILNATAQNEKGDINVTWEETPDTSTKFLMIKIQRDKTLSWEELAGLPPTIQFNHQEETLPFSKVSVYNHKDKLWETYAAPDDQTITLTEIHTYLENQLFLLLHMNPLPESETTEEPEVLEPEEDTETPDASESNETEATNEKDSDNNTEEGNTEEEPTSEESDEATEGSDTQEESPSPEANASKMMRPFVDGIVLGNQEYRSAGSSSDKNFDEYPILSNLERFDVESLAELPG